MSNETELPTEIHESTIALFLQERDMDELTDILVAALGEALHILRDEIHETVH